MLNDRIIDPRLSILSLSRRQDRRQVAISSALWSNFNIKKVRFVDAIDAVDYTSIEDILHDAVRDGFQEFEALRGYAGSLAPIAYAWSLCRYFRDLSENSGSEFFMHDDMHGVAHTHFHIDTLFLRNAYNDPIRLRQCEANGIAFACFLLNTHSMGFPPTQEHVFEEIVVGTHALNLKAGFYSPHGARLILERLQQQIALGENTPLAFLSALASTADWYPTGVFSTREPLFVEYPIAFVGSDIRGIPRLQGHFNKIFSEAKPS